MVPVLFPEKNEYKDIHHLEYELQFLIGCLESFVTLRQEATIVPKCVIVLCEHEFKEGKLTRQMCSFKKKKIKKKFVYRSILGLKSRSSL